MLLSQGHFADSLAVNQKALTARPNDALVNVQAGIAYFALGDYGHAEGPAADHPRRPVAFLQAPALPRRHLPQTRQRSRALDALKDYVARHPDLADAEHQRQRIRQLEQLLAQQDPAP